jgi:hypothetical protein
MVSFLSYQRFGTGISGCLGGLAYLATTFKSVGRQNTFNMLLMLKP